MGHAYHQLYYHFVWATHARDPHLDRSFRPAFLKILNEEAFLRGGQPIRHNAMPDHVHLLVRLPPTVTVSDFIGQVKVRAPIGLAAKSSQSSSYNGRLDMAQ